MAALGLSCGIQTLSCGLWGLVSQPGTEHGPPALAVQRLSHWTTREIPQDLFYISLISSLTLWLFSSTVQSPHICKFSSFLLLINLYFSTFMVGKMLDITSVFINFLRFLWPNIWSVLENVHLKRKYILLLLDRMFYKCVLGTSCPMRSFSPMFSYGVLIWTIYSLLKVG